MPYYITNHFKRDKNNVLLIIQYHQMMLKYRAGNYITNLCLEVTYCSLKVLKATFL